MVCFHRSNSVMPAPVHRIKPSVAQVAAATVTVEMLDLPAQWIPFGAAALAMLVDEGKLSLDDPVEKYLSEFKDQKVAAGKGAPVARVRSITIRDLLSHVSGLPFKSAEEQPTLDGLPLAEAVKTYAKVPLVTQPGTHYQYSNAGINTAARVLEVVRVQVQVEHGQGLQQAAGRDVAHVDGSTPAKGTP